MIFGQAFKAREFLPCGLSRVKKFQAENRKYRSHEIWNVFLRNGIENNVDERGEE